MDTCEDLDFVTEIIDAQFQPITRSRSNTWPCLPKPEIFKDQLEMESQGTAKTCNQNSQPTTISKSKKSTSKRNAWGNFSYADMIAQAISSSPEQRLTLSEIYEWMVRNVDYFRSKGESNSSAGWKNSIRHNLSLHNRFLKVQNEGMGKSSWWMLNPDVKPGKSTRRRAASMETSKMEKRRSVVKKRVQALRQAHFESNGGVISHLNNDNFRQRLSSTASSGGHLSPIPYGGNLENLSHVNDDMEFQWSPDFRPRVSSTASSYGRLSPIEPMIESDWSSQVVHNGNQTQAIDELLGAIDDNLTLQTKFWEGQCSDFSVPSISDDLRCHGSSNTGTYQDQYATEQPFVSQGQFVDNSIPTTYSTGYPYVEQLPDSLPNYNTLITALLNSKNNENDLGSLYSQAPVAQAPKRMQLFEDFKIDNFQGGLECNIEELIQQEMNIDGRLDISIPFSASNLSKNNSATTLVDYFREFNHDGEMW